MTYRVAALLLAALPAAASADEVGEFTNDWMGNGISVESIADPEVQGVTCWVSHFTRGMLDRLQKGNWFEDPSNATIACAQSGPIVIGDIEKGKDGEDVFSERKSLIFKSIGVRRLYDSQNETLLYVVYSRQITEGSAKMDMSGISLHGQNVTWKNP